MKSRKEMLVDVLIGTGFVVSVWALAMWWAWALAKGAI
jgi:hypothetical protein|tara:strand:+ start:162 stop:275 length:114 start_codon:yes stop_codon:yes gene_type:complete